MPSGRGISTWGRRKAAKAARPQNAICLLKPQETHEIMGVPHSTLFDAIRQLRAPPEKPRRSSACGRRHRAVAIGSRNRPVGFRVKEREGGEAFLSKATKAATSPKRICGACYSKGSATSRKSNFLKSRSTVYSLRTPCCRRRAARWASGTRLPRTGKRAVTSR